MSAWAAAGSGDGWQPGAGIGGGTGGGTYRPGFGIASPGEIRGRVADASGAVLPGVTIELGVDEFRRSTTTDSGGTYVLSGIPDGKVTMTATLTGFETQRRQLSFDQRPVQVDFRLRVGSVTETVTVSGKTPQTATTFDVADSLKKSEESAQRLVEPSQNVINLQRRAAGVCRFASTFQGPARLTDSYGPWSSIRKPWSRFDTNGARSSSWFFVLRSWSVPSSVVLSADHGPGHGQGRTRDQGLRTDQGLWTDQAPEYQAPGTSVASRYLASGLGRIWNLTTLPLVPFPPSMCHTKWVP